MPERLEFMRDIRFSETASFPRSPAIYHIFYEASPLTRVKVSRGKLAKAFDKSSSEPLFLCPLQTLYKEVWNSLCLL